MPLEVWLPRLELLTTREIVGDYQDESTTCHESDSVPLGKVM